MTEIGLREFKTHTDSSEFVRYESMHKLKRVGFMKAVKTMRKCREKVHNLEKQPQKQKCALDVSQTSGNPE